MDVARRRRGHGPLRAAVVAALVAAFAVAAGWAAAASLRVVHASAERASGVDIGLGGLPSWWTGFRVLSAAVPPVVPSSLNTTAAAPTHLPAANVSYLLNSASAGTAAIAIDYRESVTAPGGAEVELRFTLSLTGGPPVTVRGYIETGTSPPTFPVLVRFLFATGPLTLSGATIQSVTVSPLLCSAVGSCP